MTYNYHEPFPSAYHFWPFENALPWFLASHILCTPTFGGCTLHYLNFCPSCYISLLIMKFWFCTTHIYMTLHWLPEIIKISNDGCFAATILLYPAALDRILGKGILMLVCIMKFSVGSCFAATILLYPAPTGQDARGGDPKASTYDEVQHWWLLRSNHSIVSGPHWTGC